MRPDPSLSILLAATLTVGCGSEVRIGGQGSGTGIDDGNLRPPDNQLPVAVCEADPPVITPGSAADFLGQDSNDPDGIPIIDHNWQLIERPQGSQARLPPGQTNRVGFRPDLAGPYVARLIVTNDRGSTSASCDATLDVEPSQDLWVEAIPQYPGEDDIRVMVARGRTISDDFNANDVCFYKGCNVNWGGGPKNPRVLGVETEDGVSSVAIPQPADGSYLIGLVDGPDKVLMGKQDVILRVFLFGELAGAVTTTISGEDPRPIPLFRVTFPDGALTPL